MARKELVIHRANWYPSSVDEVRTQTANHNGWKKNMNECWLANTYDTHDNVGVLRLWPQYPYTFDDPDPHYINMNSTDKGEQSGYTQGICSDTGHTWRWVTKSDRQTCTTFGRVREDWGGGDRPLLWNTVGVYFEWNTKGSYWGDSHISLNSGNVYGEDPPVVIHMGKCAPRGIGDQRGKIELLHFQAKRTWYKGENPQDYHIPNSDTRNAAIFCIENKYWNDVFVNNFFIMGVTFGIKTYAYKNTNHTRQFNIFNLSPWAYCPSNINAKLIRTAPQDWKQYAEFGDQIPIKLLHY